jgi:alginate O-acetyltransferase complex protein AlgI
LLFHSYSFLFLFLPVVLALYWRPAARPAARTWVLILAGVVFYSFAGLARLGLLLTLALVTFAGVRFFIASPVPSRRRIGLAVVGLDLAVLLAFKLAATPGFASAAWVAFPLGLSFYTFNLVGHALDVYRGRTPPAASASSLISFSTFFPTVSAGPLLRYDDFERQLLEPRRFDALLLEAGLVSLVVGLAKKLLVADPLGIAIEPLFASYERLGFWDSWLAVLGYAYQLYFDFSGYTDMAIGVGALLGFRLPQNFNAPYTAVHITDFWQRWHITMSQWFRDYLFLPLSRALLRRSPSLEAADRLRTACLLVTMVAIGLWHGATWSFLAWGLYHGVLLAGHARIRASRRPPLPGWVSRSLTFLAVLAGWVLLRSPSPGMALRIWEAMLGLNGPGQWAWTGTALGPAVLLLLVVTNSSAEGYLLQPRFTAPRAWALAALLVLSLLSLGGRSPFLYFQF